MRAVESACWVILRGMNEMPPIDPRQLIEDELERRGMSKKELSLALGLNHAYIQQFVTRGTPKRLPEGVREGIQRLIGIPSDRLKTIVPGSRTALRTGSTYPPRAGAGLPPTLPPSNVRFGQGGATLPDLRALPRDIEVRGIAAGGGLDMGDSSFMWNGEVVDRIRRPPGIADLKSVAAIYIQGDSMAEWRQPGEAVYFTAAKPPRVGDHVLVELHGDTDGAPGPAYVKKLVRRTEKALILLQYNPRREIEIDARRVKHIYRILEWPELLGL